jgi:transposase InsO family protein
MKFEVIRAEKANFPVELMCEALGVSRAGYYKWTHHEASERAKSTHALSEKIEAVFLESRRTYGSPRVLKELQAQGHRVGHNRVASLMRFLGLRSKRKKKFVVTTDSVHSDPVAENVLNRSFWPKRMNERWATDITYVPTAEGWLYLAVVIDLFSRRVIGWSTSRSLERKVALDALRMASGLRGPAAGALHHSDRGCQYTSEEYQLHLSALGMLASMSRRANCWDNAPVESFFGTLKTELTHHERYQTRDEATASIADYIEGFYNPRRRHTSLGYLSPIEYERQQQWPQLQAA